jgi:transcriptional regulator with XRE-family HTH domain
MSKDTDILKKFGKRVQELRLRKGITSQITLANKAGLDRTYMGGIERGERNVGLKNIEKIAKSLGVSIDELFKF